MLQSRRLCEHSLTVTTRPVLILTDGVYENGVATAGAVVVDGPMRVAYAIRITKTLVKLWTRVA